MKTKALSCGRTVAAAIAVLLALCGTTAYAQNESGVRYLNRDAFRGLGLWYDSSLVVYPLRYPIIRSIPPLSTGMPYNVLQGYVHLDSLMRFGTILSSQNQFGARGTGSIPPELKELGARLYELVDYDPILFEQYQGEVSLKSKKYRSTLRGLYTNIRQTLRGNASLIRDGKAILSALHPNYVLRVRVVAVDSQSYRPVLMEGSNERYLYRATAEVLEILKGQVLPPCIGEAYMARGDESQGSPGRSLPCIRFLYDRYNYQLPSDYHSEGGSIYKERDSAFMTADGYFRMKEGQEAVVFVHHNLLMLDSAADYFSVNLAMDASYNALPIINGAVRDVNRVWSPNETLPYEEWKRRFEMIREKILTGTY